MSTNIDIFGPVRAAQAADLAAVTVQVAHMNDVLKASYLAAFNVWVQEGVGVGRPAPSDPPKPPMAMVAGFFDDPTTGPSNPQSPFGDAVVQWPYAAVSKTPVCDMPPIPTPPTHTIEAGKIGPEDPTDPGWFSALPGDTTPGGKKVVGVSADGKSGLFQKWASSFNSNTNTGEVGGWYQKIG